MTDKELRRLSRQNLIELLCRQKKEDEALKNQIAELRALLADRRIKIENAGTLAEAMISVNGVMDAAQKAAEQYLEEIKTAQANTEKECSELLAKTKEACARREEEADRQICEKWIEFENKAENYIHMHAELETLMDSGKNRRGNSD